MCSSIDHERQEMKKHADIVRYLSNFSDTKKKKKKREQEELGNTWKKEKKKKEEKMNLEISLFVSRSRI